MLNYKMLLITLTLLSVISCTPQTQDLATETAINATIACLEAVVLQGLDFQVCVEGASAVVANGAIGMVQDNLDTWTDGALRQLGDAFGLELPRSFSRDAVIEGVGDSFGSE